jgi:hypothetical protein
LKSLYDAYRREAEICQRMALESPTEQLRVSFMLQASDWLSMIPPALQVTGVPKTEGEDNPDPEANLENPSLRQGGTQPVRPQN